MGGTHNCAKLSTRSTFFRTSRILLLNVQCLNLSSISYPWAESNYFNKFSWINSIWPKSPLHRSSHFILQISGKIIMFSKKKLPKCKRVLKTIKTSVLFCQSSSFNYRIFLSVSAAFHIISNNWENINFSKTRLF